VKCSRLVKRERRRGATYQLQYRAHRTCRMVYVEFDVNQAGGTFYIRVDGNNPGIRSSNRKPEPDLGQAMTS